METSKEATMIQLDTTKRAARMIQAGRVTVTFRSPSGQHITLLAKCRGKVNGKWQSTPLAEAQVIFIEVPSQGGWNDKVGKINSRGFTPDANADQARIFCAKQLLAFLAGQPTATGLEIFEEEHCGRCGRALTDPTSIERGIGPECYGRLTGSQHETKQHTRTIEDERDAEQASEIAAENAAVIAAGRDAENAAQLDRDSDFGSPIPADLDAQWAAFHEAEAQRESEGDGRDSKGVPYGYGDWRGRQRAAQQIRGKAPQRETSPACRQLDSLPGTSWEDIFQGRAIEMGIILPNTTVS